MLTLMLIIGITMTGIPVKAEPTTRVYVKMPPEGYILGAPVGSYVTVEIWIEGAVDMVQWSLSVEVDPTVLEPVGAKDGSGTVIYDYVDEIWWAPGQVFVVGVVDKPGGKIIDVSHVINAWADLYPEGYTGFSGDRTLCLLRFKSLSETAYSPINLYDVLLFDGLYWETVTPHYFPPDIVEDGHYNQLPPAIPPYVVATAVGTGIIIVVAIMTYFFWVRKPKSS